MKTIAVIFSHAPHGTSLGREGLDAILGISVLIKDISLFFIGDGVFQLLNSYNPEQILSRNYIPAFSILSLFNIHNFYCCQSSLRDRGLYNNIDFNLNIKVLKPKNLSTKLDCYDAIINF